ncbi:PFL-like glycyl radical enzyme, partial [Lentinus tigrinus ALCF2SS1-6]
RNLYPSLWIPDIFMRRLRDRQMWTLFDPRDVPLLLSTYGDQFSTAYENYEDTVAPIDQIATYDLWIAIARAQQESGTPFLMYQDAINGKNNHSHLGIIRTSNLCTEIVQFTSATHTAVCTLASIAVPRFAAREQAYDFDALYSTTRLAVLCTDALLDNGTYPGVCKLSATQTRALAIGVQGLADTFMICNIPFDSESARTLNREIFETIYHAAYSTSCELAEQRGPYPLYADSRASRGTLQHDMWSNVVLTGRHDFSALRERILRHGVRHSMLTAQMPTASTAKLLGNFDGTEPYSSNVITHRILSGDYTEICPWLVGELSRRSLWSEETRVAILQQHGSIQNIDGIPDNIKDVFRTAWEIDPRAVIDLAADRAPFIDQTQSMSLNVRLPGPEILLNLQMHTWSLGLKTGIYYLRTRAPVYPLPFGVGSVRVHPQPTRDAAREVWTSEAPTAGACDACSG